MQKQHIISEKLEIILKGADPNYLINDIDGTTKILLNDCEFGYFSNPNEIIIPFNLIFSNCVFISTFCLKATSKNEIIFLNNGFIEDLSLYVNCNKLIIRGKKISWLTLGLCRIKEVKIHNVDISSIYIKKGIFDRFSIFCMGNSNSIDVEDTNFKELLELGNETIEKSLFSKILFSNVEGNEVKILNSSFDGNFEIKGEKSKYKKCILGNVVFEEILKFSDISIDDLSLKNSSLKKNLEIEKCNFKNFDLENVFFEENFKFFDVTVDNLYLNNSSIEKNLEIEKCNFISLKIDKLNKVNIFQIQDSVTIENFYFENTTIVFTLLLNRAKVNNLYFENFNSGKDSLIYINSNKVNQLVFTNFNNFGNLYLISLIQLYEDFKEKSLIKIFFSDLGKTIIMDCDFEKSFFEFYSSKINDIYISGTKLPPQNKINVDNIDLLQKRIVLSQIKKNLENSGNIIEASKFQSDEIDVHYKSLKFGSEKFNLFLNKYSNDHGQSWTLALLTTLAIAILFFLLYNWSLEYTFNCKSILDSHGYKFLLDFSSFTENFKYFFDFLNPTHKFDFISEKKSNLSVATGFWDFLSRIFIGYGIYQFISAFRKHNKKI